MELSAARHIGTVVAMPLPAYEPPIQAVVRFRGSGRRRPDDGPESAAWWLPRTRRRQPQILLWERADAPEEAPVPSVPEPVEPPEAPSVVVRAAESDGALPPERVALGRTPEASKLAGAVVEALIGRRPVAQLRRWVSREVLEVLAATRSFGDAARLRKVQTNFPTPIAAEALALVEDGARTRMVVLRCDRMDHGQGRPRWQCTHVSVG